MGHAAAIEDVRRKLREFPFVEWDWKWLQKIIFILAFGENFKYLSRSENKYTLYRLNFGKAWNSICCWGHAGVSLQERVQTEMKRRRVISNKMASKKKSVQLF